MTSVVKNPHPLTAPETNVDNFLTACAEDERIGPQSRAAARTVRLQQRRRTFPESRSWGRLLSRGWVPEAVDNFVFRELSSLALFL